MPPAHDTIRTAAEERGGRGRINAVLVIVALVLAGGLWFGTNAMLRRASAARLPDLPDLSSAPAPVAEQLREADAIARRHPTSGAYVGALARTYHADTFSRLARACYELAAEYDAGAWRWPYALILLHEEQGDTSAALQALRGFVTRKDDHALAWFRLGEAEFNVGNDRGAREAFEQCDRLSSTDWPIHGPREPFFPLGAYARFGLARIAFRQEHFADVEGLLQPVIEEVPRFGPAHRLLGQAYQRLDRADEAERELDLALRCGPYSPPVDPFVDELTMLSRSSTFLLKESGVAFNKGDVAWSERVLRRALEFYPNEEDVLGEITLLLVRLRRFEEAMPYLDRYLDAPPSHYATPTKIAGELVKDPRYVDRAIECYELALELQPGEPTNSMNLGMALATAGRFDEAEPLFRRTLEMEPHNTLARRNLARLLFDTKRYEQAIGEFETVLEIRPGDADGWYHLGRAQEMLDRIDEAIATYRRGLEAAGDEPRLLDALAIVLAQEGRFDEAFEASRRLIEIAGDRPQAHYTLARVAVLAGDAERAREACRRALQIDDQFAPARDLLDRIEE